MNTTAKALLVTRSEAHRALQERGITIGLRAMESLADRLPHGRVLMPGYKARRLYNFPVIMAAIREAASSDAALVK